MRRRKLSELKGRVFKAATGSQDQLCKEKAGYKDFILGYSSHLKPKVESHFWMLFLDQWLFKDCIYIV